MTAETRFTEISPSEFFYRNRDLAGFSNPSRALYMTVRELVENSLDACDYNKILPHVTISIKPIEKDTADPQQYVVTVTDNGPGIAPDYVPMAFGKVLYGTNFTLKQARGMFGLGATMAILYGQITANKPVVVNTTQNNKMYEYILQLDIQRNRPLILSKTKMNTNGFKGLSLSITLEGDFGKAQNKIRDYVSQTALITPYANILLKYPKDNKINFKRITKIIPPAPLEIKPHPTGVDVETLRRSINSEYNTPPSFGEDMKEHVKRELSAERINQSAETVADLAKKRWTKLSKSVRTASSLLVLLDINLDDLEKIRVDNVDIPNSKISYITLLDENYHTIKLKKINPFFKHLLSLVEGDTITDFMTKNFQRVGPSIAKKFLDFANIDRKKKVGMFSNDELVALADAMQRYPGFLVPDASCLSPLGERLLESSIKKIFNPEFVATVQRPPSAYSGFPFIVEMGMAYGGDIKTKSIKLNRFANRIPLLYDEGNDVSMKVIEDVDWPRYKISQDSPLIIVTHICSTRVPYKTVGKEYIADRAEIEYEIRNGMRFLGRKLAAFLSKKGHIEMQKKRAGIYSKYIPMLAQFATELAKAKKMPRYNALLKLGEEVEGSSQSQES
ncbi:MAG: DNA topoisomerase VI subunit B [Thaumarchaeota archaeon]|nr:DNA topoisomerase VI subunit B [Nitrososphaerota archaeon]|tara:strand:- start:1489 stop:3342 length:1854 start_codon:yes stop_codon:yes gene_type:complete